MSAVPPGIPTGVHLILERRGRVLLMRRANTGFFDGLFSLPGGHLEPGESVEMAAAREAREELGVNLAPAQLDLIGVMHRLSDTNRIDFFVRVSNWLGEARRAEPDKCDQLIWVDPDDLPEAVVPYVRLALAASAPEPWIRQIGWDP